MAAPRSVTLFIAATLAACSGSSATSSPVVTQAAALTPAATPTARPTPSSSPIPSPIPSPLPSLVASPSPIPSLVPSPVTSPTAGVDPATALRIAPPYELVAPSATDFDQLSGNIRGLPSDLADGAGAGYSPSDFPIGFRFVSDGDRSVGVLVILAMPPEVAGQPGLLESVAAAVAAEVNAHLSYETIEGVKVGVARGPIASAVAIVDGHLVMAQSGQPAVHPTDLIAAVITAD